MLTSNDGVVEEQVCRGHRIPVSCTCTKKDLSLVKLTVSKIQISAFIFDCVFILEKNIIDSPHSFVLASEPSLILLIEQTFDV